MSPLGALRPSLFGVILAFGHARDPSGRPLPSGIYLARLVTPEYTRSIKMLLLK